MLKCLISESDLPNSNLQGDPNKTSLFRYYGNGNKRCTFENLLSIRPKGVVSKNAIGERKIRDNIVPCRTEAAFKVPTEITTVAIIIKPAYYIGKK